MNSKELRVLLNRTYSDWAKDKGYNRSTVGNVIAAYITRTRGRQTAGPVGIARRILLDFSRDVGRPVCPEIEPVFTDSAIA